MQFSILMILVKLLIFGSLTAASIRVRTGAKKSYKALYDFASQAIGELDLHRGDVVTVLQEDASGWWLVERPDGSVQGWTPGSYLSALSSRPSSSMSQVLSRLSKIAISSPSSTASTVSTKAKSPSSQTTSSTGLINARPSTSLRPATNPQPISRPSSSPSVKRSSSSSTTLVGSFVLPFSTSQLSSASSSSSSSSLSASSQASTAIATSATTPNVGIYANVSSPAGNTGSSSPTIISATSNATPSITDTVCLLNCNITTSTPTPVSTPVSSPTACLGNCGSTNTSLVNITSQAISTSSNDAAVPTECADPGGVNGVTTACWDALDMSKYINEWSLSHRAACHAQTPFAQCFLQLLDTGMNDCVSISSGTCPPPSWIQFKDHNMSVRDFYVAYNIYAVWTFFNSYYLAIGNARSASTDSIAGIVSLLNPTKTNNAELSNLNFALGIGLTFVKLDGFAAPLTESLIGIVVNAAKQAPQVARYLFPGPPGDTKFVQLGQISNQMGTLTDNLQKNVAIALSVIQNDTSTFLSFTGSGAFSNNPVVKMDQQSDSLLTALNTYVISLCLQANDWQISRAIDTDMNQLMANGTKLTWNIPDCGTGYNQNSICGAYYWNKTIDVSYTLTNTDDMFQNPAPIMQQFFANWTTPQLLFDGALQCQMDKGTGQPNINPNAGTSDVTSTPCLSSLKICTWDLNPSHFGTQYEYTDCDVQNDFATQGCTHCDATTDWCTNVPSSYVGGYLLNPDAEAPQYTYCNNGDTTITTN